MKNRRILLLAVSLPVVFFSCKDKASEEPGNFIPVGSIIKGQLNDIDTSLYSIIKINYKDNIVVDTEYIRREDVRSIAKDFLEVPVLSKKAFTEENIPGPMEGLSTISYTPIKPKDQQVQRVDLVLDPKLERSGQNVIKSIFIESGFSNRDSAVQKKLLWQLDRSFQVTTIVQRKGQDEINTTFRLIWNDSNE